jgi:hypothetical protein
MSSLRARPFCAFAVRQGFKDGLARRGLALCLALPQKGASLHFDEGPQRLTCPLLLMLASSSMDSPAERRRPNHRRISEPIVYHCASFCRTLEWEQVDVYEDVTPDRFAKTAQFAGPRN